VTATHGNTRQHTATHCRMRKRHFSICMYIYTCNSTCVCAYAFHQTSIGMAPRCEVRVSATQSDLTCSRTPLAMALVPQTWHLYLKHLTPHTQQVFRASHMSNEHHTCPSPQLHNTTGCHDFGTTNSNLIQISTVSWGMVQIKIQIQWGLN